MGGSFFVAVLTMIAAFLLISLGENSLSRNSSLFCLVLSLPQ